MKKIRCLVIDDERLSRAELIALLQEVGGCEVIGESSNAKEAIQMIRELQPDLLFLDIDMPGSNGFELLAQLDNPPQVVFATAYDQYAIRAFEVKALDYLLKPIRLERLGACLETVTLRLSSHKPYLERLFISSPQGGYFLGMDQVQLIRSYGHYLRFYHGTETSLVHRSLKSIADQLDPSQFFQINRSEIIKVNAVESTDRISRGRYQIQLANEQLIVSEARAVIWRKRFRG